MMLTPRRIEIFKAIVDEFVQTAEPVGSKTLMEKYQLPYSSATIRNDMMVLEEMGLLEKTHTSSGRIPSTKGYKFYCEHLMEHRIDNQLEVAVRQQLASKPLNLDDAIRESCNILSQMTNLTSGVLGPDASRQRLEHVKLFPISNRSAVAVFITDLGHTENRTFQFDDDLSVEDIQTCCQILNDRLKGTLIKDVVDKMDSIKPILAAHVKRHEMLFQAFVNAFVKFASENVYFSGQNNMLYQPEFADIEKLKELMTMMENPSLWRQIGTTANSELALKMNENAQLVWVNDMAVVTSKFKLGSDEEGQLMVFGPSRMDYDRIVSLLELVSQSIESLYGKGGSHE